MRPDGRFFQLVRNVRSVHAHIVHFQLRNLVWATSRNDVYLVTDNCITHWSPITRRATPVMDLGGPPAAPLLSGVGRMQVGPGAPCPPAPLPALLPACTRLGPWPWLDHASCCLGSNTAPYFGSPHVATLTLSSAVGSSPQPLLTRPPLPPLPPQVSTMCVGEDIIAAGGFNGELAVQRMGCPDMMFCGRISNSDNGITNGLEMVEPGRAGALLVSANNDNKVRRGWGWGCAWWGCVQLRCWDCCLCMDLVLV